MRIGIDFDNTIACYDKVFQQLAKAYEIKLSAGCQDPKTELKKALSFKEEGAWEWTKIQGLAYGKMLIHAEPFNGFLETARNWKRDHELFLVSHKSRYPTAGESFDLPEAAEYWIQEKIPGIFNKANLFFEETLEGKIERISKIGCTVFIDDLEQVLTHKYFPEDCQQILFKPSKPSPFACFSEWTTPPSIKKETNRQSSFDKSTDPGLIDQLAQQGLGAKIASSTNLHGGRNSTVSKIELQNGDIFVIKKYKENHPQRYRRERSFLHLLNAKLLSAKVPKLLASSEKDHANAISFLTAQTVEKPSEAHWCQCLKFVEDLQQIKESEEAKALPPASEATTSLQTGLGFTSRRRNLRLQWAKQQPTDNRVASWIESSLEVAFQTLAKNTICHPAFKFTLRQEEMIISPSDYGLHNSLVDSDGQLVFFDFEYSGWDDPAKAWSDFFLQPHFPAPDSLRKQALTAWTLTLDSQAIQRLSDRLPYVYACCCLNWIYIILNARLLDTANLNLSAPLMNNLQARLDQALLAIKEPQRIRESAF